MRSMMVGERRVGWAVRHRLGWGFGFLVLLVVGIGLSSWGMLSAVVSRLGVQLAGVQGTAVLTSELASLVAREMRLGDRLAESDEHTVGTEYQRVSDSAHSVQHVLAGRPGMPDEELRLLANLDQQLAELEVRYAYTGVLYALGREPMAASAHMVAQSDAIGLFESINRLSLGEQARVTRAGIALTESIRRRTMLFVTALVVVLLLALAAVSGTSESIRQPLDQLLLQAESFRRGDLTARTGGVLPAEFSTLRDALDGAGESLSRLVRAVGGTIDEVNDTAGQLATVSEQISSSAGQVAGSMNEVMNGAMGQATALKQVDDALADVRSLKDGTEFL